MNYSSAIFLVNKDVRAVNVSYEKTADGKGVAPFYTFKTLDQTLAVGDLVTIPTETRHCMTVARVEEVDVEVDLESPTQLKWLVGRVDPAPYENIVAQESAAITQMKSAERRAKQEELAAKLIADNPDLKNLTFVDPSAPALPAPSAEAAEA